MSDFLKDSLNRIGVEPSDNQIEQLNKFYEMLVEKNKVMNLTAITEYEDVVIKHFIDSLIVQYAYPVNKVKSVIDVGTGAGFPGIVLKIFNKDVNFTLLDSLNKRINFLNEVKEELGLDKLSLIHGRAEDFARKPEYREQFDICVSRAVANLSTLAEYCLPFVKKGGFFIAMKGAAEEDSYENALKELFGKVESENVFTLPESDFTRRIICVNKIENLSTRYPRKAGIPKKNPL